MGSNIIISLYKTPQTIFSLKDLSLLFPELSYNNLKERMSYYTQSGSIKKLSRGIYAKDKYSILELANKLYTPSYISLETVFQRDGVIFQHDEGIYSVSYLSRIVDVDSHTITYRRIRKDILMSNNGIERIDETNIASTERAFLDAVYLYKDYHFDNLRPLNWDKVKNLQVIYNSKTFIKRIEEYYKIYKEDNA